MYNTKTRIPSKFLLLAAAAGTLVVGASGVASATTEPPGGSMPPGADGSAEASSPEAEAFCMAEVAVEAAFGSEDPAAIGPAVEALTAATPAEIQETVDAVLATAETQGPEFDAAYGEMIEWMRANCGFAELNLTAEEYSYGGLPPEVPAGPTIVGLANIGEEVHEAAVIRLNDDVTLTFEELSALSVDEFFMNGTPATFAFAFPEAVGYGVADLQPGRYLALCFLPEHADPEVIAQMEGPDSSAPPGHEFGPEHFTLGMIQEFTVA